MFIGAKATSNLRMFITNCDVADKPKPNTVFDYIVNHCRCSIQAVTKEGDNMNFRGMIDPKFYAKFQQFE
jgi:hypothetical protein